MSLDPLTDVFWAILQCYAVRFTAIEKGDCIRVSHEDGSAVLMFGREPEAMRAWGIAGRAAA